MRRAAKVILAVCLCIAAASSPAFAGNVLCKTSSGHLAIEPPHESGGCRVLEATNEQPVHDQDPCQDQVLTGGDLAGPPPRLNTPSIDYTNVVELMAPSEVVYGTLGSASVDWFYPAGLPPLSASQQRLDTIVLII